MIENTYGQKHEKEWKSGNFKLLGVVKDLNFERQVVKICLKTYHRKVCLD